MDRLSNKVALVIGGAKGIGLGIARRFAAEGAEVFLTGRSEADLAAAAKDVGVAARTIRADASDTMELRRAVEVAAGARGRLDVLVVMPACRNTAGSTRVITQGVEVGTGQGARLGADAWGLAAGARA